MGAMDMLNVGLDAYSVLICLLLGVHALLERDARLLAMNRCFAGMCLTNVVMALGDMTSWAPAPPLDAVGYAIVLAGSFAFYVAVVPIYMFLTGYLVAYFDRRVHGAVAGTSDGAPVIKRSALVLPLTVFAVYLAVCIASLFVDLLFTVTPEHGYARGPVFWLSQAAVIVLHLYNAVIIVTHARAMTARERIAFASWVLLPALANGVQVFNFGIALLNQSITCALLIVFIGIQSERRAMLAARDQELAEMRAAMMLSQIQPHFLYNALAAIRELCRTDADAAVTMVTDFSVYLRENMKSLTSRQPIPFERELEHTRTYLMLEERRYGDRLRWELDIRATDFSLPPLSVQPLAENAVRHGIVPREEGGCVRISSRAEGERYLVVVEDDGVGFDTGAGPGAGHVGIENVRRRMRDVCGGSLEIESAPGRGTRATLAVPRDADGTGGASVAPADARG